MNRPRKWTSLIWPSILILLVSGGACGRKGTQVRPSSGEAVSRSESTRAPGTLLAPDRQIPWTYEAMPKPEPSRRPEYLLRSVGFSQGGSSLDLEASGALRDLAAQLKQKGSTRVLAVGFADNAVEAGQAESLALQRARSAADLLVRQGVPLDRIEITSFGATQATGHPSDRIALAKDRRAEVWLLTE